MYKLVELFPQPALVVSVPDLSSLREVWGFSFEILFKYV